MYKNRVGIFVTYIIVRTQNMVQVLAKRNMLGDLVTCKMLNYVTNN